jgi:hypothetical protein
MLELTSILNEFWEWFHDALKPGLAAAKGVFLSLRAAR